jgi:hypothetical protein
MSVLAKLKAASAPEGKRLFCVVAGPRLGGKTTLAGTLPGRTLLLQAAVLESGSESAKALAERNGHELDVVNFTTADELLAVLKELESDKSYDNVYVDGLSALTEMKLRDPKIAKVIKTNVWDGYRELGEAANEVILQLKALTYAEKAAKPKATFLTCALKIKQDKSGNVVDVELETKGNMAVSAITKLGEAVVTVLPAQRTENGEIPHRIITKTQDFWPGRIDGLLSDQNPGELAADLSKVLELRGVS